MLEARKRTARCGYRGGLVDFLRELRLVFVFIGCTRLAGSDYPMDTKFLTLSKGVLCATEAEIADAVYSLSDLTACVHSSLNEAENARYMLRHPRKSEGKTPVNTSKEG